MRYRRLGYRYAMILSAGQPRRLGNALDAARIGFALAPPRWRPPADVVETPGAVLVTVELAGVDQDNLSVLLYDDMLIVEGQRRLAACEAGGVYHAAEIRHGPFRVEIPLPATVESGRVDARYEHGLLHIALPKPDGAGDR